MSNRRIAKRLGIGEATVRRCSGASGDAPEQRVGSDGKVYPSGRLQQAQLKEKREEAKRLHTEEGLTIREIATRLEVCPTTAHSYVNAPLPPDGSANGNGKRAWYDIDPHEESARVCLSAMEAGITQLNAELRAGTATIARGKQVQRICMAIAKRVRDGTFDYQQARRELVRASG